MESIDNKQMITQNLKAHREKLIEDYNYNNSEIRVLQEKLDGLKRVTTILSGEIDVMNQSIAFLNNIP